MDERVDDRGLAGAGRPDAPDAETETSGVLTLVCLTCGNEYYSSEGDPPADLTCGKCGSTVFRSYFSHEEADEANQDFRDATERDLDPDDAEGDTLPGDLIDLDLDRG